MNLQSGGRSKADRNVSFPRAAVPCDVGLRVRAERLRRRWSAERLAQRVGVNRRTIVRLEAGLHAPGSQLVHALEHVLGFENRGLFRDWADAPDFDRPGRGGIARARRRMIGLSLSQVAELAGVSVATLSRFERGLSDSKLLVDPGSNGIEALLPAFAAALGLVYDEV